VTLSVLLVSLWLRRLGPICHGPFPWKLTADRPGEINDTEVHRLRQASAADVADRMIESHPDFRALRLQHLVWIIMGPSPRMVSCFPVLRRRSVRSPAAC
jgi:hypothetical protein